MKQLKALATITAALLAIGTAGAKPITAAQAKAAVLKEAKEIKALRNHTGRLTLAYTKLDTAEQPSLYIFDRPNGGGFIIASADDEALPLLGYTDEGSFIYNEMPDNMRYFLDEYANEIEALRDGRMVDDANQRLSSLTFNEVKPLLGSIAWDQKAPFNDRCPVLSGTQRCATGCVATATGQIMYYHKYPIAGTGAHSYDDNGTTRYDAFTDVIDWESMLPYYNDASSQAAKDAVSTLMWKLGVASEMKYGSTSSATSHNMLVGLVEYFKYDRGVIDYERARHPLGEWKQMLYDELAAGRPINYGGMTGTDSGHQFVLDGNDADGLFHINWGWAGRGNGYYSITALLPTTRGTGAGTGGGYNYKQSAMIGLQPDRGSLPADGLYVITEQCAPAGVGPYTAGTTVEFDLGRVSNHGSLTAQFSVAVGLFIDGNMEAVSEPYGLNLQPWYGMPGPNIVKFTLPELSYYSGKDVEFRPVYKMAGQTVDRWRIAGASVPVGIAAAYYNGGSRTYRFTDDDKYHVGITGMGIAKAYAYYPSNLKFHMVNSGTLEFAEDVIPVVYDISGSTKVTSCDPFLIDLESGQSDDFVFPVTIEATEGNYLLCLELNDGTSLGSCYITLKPEPAKADLSLQSYSMPGGDRVTDNHIYAVATVHNAGGYFNGSICGMVCDEYGTAMKDYLGITNVEIDAGGTAAIVIDGVTTMPPGDYALHLGYIDGNTIYRIHGTDELLYFTLLDGTGIEQIMADGRAFKATPTPAVDVLHVNAVGVRELRLYAIDGSLVAQSYNSDTLNVSHIAAGGYVLECVTAEGTYTTRVAKQ